MMIDENDHQYNPKAIKTSTSCEQIVSLNVNDRILNNHLGSTSLSSQTQSWESILEKSINAIVSIKANCVRSFDTEESGEYLFILLKKYNTFITQFSNLIFFFFNNFR